MYVPGIVLMALCMLLHSIFTEAHDRHTIVNPCWKTRNGSLGRVRNMPTLQNCGGTALCLNTDGLTLEPRSEPLTVVLFTFLSYSLGTCEIVSLMHFIKEFLVNEKKEFEGNSSHNPKAHSLLHAHRPSLQKPNSVQPVYPEKDAGGGSGGRMGRRQPQKFNSWLWT